MQFNSFNGSIVLPCDAFDFFQSFKLNIYSIVNTLTQMPGITRVQFLINGEIFGDAVENIRIDGLFEKNMSLVYRPEKGE